MVSEAGGAGKFGALGKHGALAWRGEGASLGVEDTWNSKTMLGVPLLCDTSEVILEMPIHAQPRYGYFPGVEFLILFTFTLFFCCSKMKHGKSHLMVQSAQGNGKAH